MTQDELRIANNIDGTCRHCGRIVRVRTRSPKGDEEGDGRPSRVHKGLDGKRCPGSGEAVKEWES